MNNRQQQHGDIVEHPDNNPLWENRCSRCFPREYGKIKHRLHDWKKMYMEWERRALLFLPDDYKTIFTNVRADKFSDEDSLTDDQIAVIYHSMAKKDFLGYELLQLCSQRLLDRIYKTYQKNIGYPYGQFYLGILCNKPDEVQKILHHYSYTENPENFCTKSVLINGIIEEKHALNLSDRITNDHDVSYITFQKDQLLLQHILVKNTFIKIMKENNTQPSAGNIPDGEKNQVFYLNDDTRLHSALQLAAKYGYDDLAKLLIGYGANLDASDAIHQYSNNTPPPHHIAVLFRHERVVKTLCSNLRVSHVFPNRKFFDTALDYAVLSGCWSLCKIILFEQNHIQSPWLTPFKIAFKESLTLCCHADQNLIDALKSLQDNIQNSQLDPKDKLFIATKTIQMVRVITNSYCTNYEKETAIRDFYDDTVHITPRLSQIYRVILIVTAAAVGFVFGAAAVGVLAGLGITYAALSGVACAGGSAFFAHKYISNNDIAQSICDSAKKTVPAV